MPFRLKMLAIGSSDAMPEVLEGPLNPCVSPARTLTNRVDGFLADKRFLIIDRDSKCSTAFRDLLKDSGVAIVRLPPQSPDLNAYVSHCTSYV